MTFDLAGIFVAGLLTFVSPCILPMVPLYLALVGGASVAELRSGAPSRIVARTAAFALGLAAVFVALGLAAGGAGRALAAHRTALLAISGAAMVLSGLRFLGVLRLRAVERERRPWLHRVGAGGSIAGAFAFGAAFALGWTPCIGPVLGSVLTYTASAGASAPRGALYLTAYASGLVLPLLAAAAFAPRVLRLLDRARPHLRKVEVVTGALLFAVGVLVASDRLGTLVPPASGADAARSPTAAEAARLPAESVASAGGPAPACTTPAVDGSTCSAAQLSPGAARSEPGFTVAVDGPAVVEIMSRSCPICRLMAPIVAEAERGCPARVVRAYVEEATGAELARRHAIRGVPTFLVLDASGRELQRLVGQQQPGAIRAALQLVSPALCSAAVPPGALGGGGS